MKDYYSILGVPKTATIDDIKKAYRKLAIKYHPDTNAGDKEAEAKFKEISEAYSVLSDESKKAQYDQYGSTNTNNQDPFGFARNGFDFSDMFNEFFGGGFGRSRSQQRQQVVRAAIEVPLGIALVGGTIPYTLKLDHVCNSCGGRGASEYATCPQCGGTGMRHLDRQSVMRVSLPCPQCGGSGRIPTKACSVCGGSGKVAAAPFKLDVNIPAGTRDGSNIIVENVYPVDNNNKLSVLFEVRVRYPDISKLTKDEIEILRKL